ncbi:embryogenesis-associated protein EMB8-like isoform X2 [Vicia villosa]|uniref:embryogenesis-associated protein EMB8-like isoform X2 n=1 Tax=Vicia villosa TaxID=3911 RepID=UPI00273ABEFC|nr:embryogenesis-associated protein EMB8-like isoform X2 [Vicia villosa]
MESDPSSSSNGYLFILKGLSLLPIWHYLLIFTTLLICFLYNFLEIHFFEDLFTGFSGSPVDFTYNSSSEIYSAVVSKCRILHGRYSVTPWLSSPHLQTVFLNFFGRPPVFSYKRQLFTTSDGGTLALDWVINSDDSSSVVNKDESTPIAILIPGLTSDSSAPYLKHLAYHTAKRGWKVVVSNHRGLGGVPITSDVFYNSGWTEDTRTVVNYLHKENPKAPLFMVGNSVGANILVKYLGEEGENTPVAGAVAICSPWDLLAISIRDFDDHATRLFAKYETVDTYYRRCSSTPYVKSVAIPLLCISALDDPVCTKEAIPWDECRLNKNIVLATVKHGGHLAFFEGITASSLWWVRAANEFLDVLHSSPYMHEQKQVSKPKAPLDSSIDQSPYINVTQDGMVAALDSEPTTENQKKNK